jgi:hypothetical protein
MKYVQQSALEDLVLNRLSFYKLISNSRMF